MTITIRQPRDLLELIGRDLGTSSWLAIPQRDIDLFADATHDRQWIHVDVERAARSGHPSPTATSPCRCSSRCGRRSPGSKTSA